MENDKTKDANDNKKERCEGKSFNARKLRDDGNSLNERKLESERRLRIELVPDGCFHYNLRYVLPKKLWNFVRKTAYDEAGGRCAVCGKKTTKFHAHETWEYDGQRGVAKLIKVSAVCAECHSAIHMNYTALKGDLESAENHYMKVNGVSFSEMKKDLGEANEKQKKLNEVPEWVIDISYLKRYVKDD